MLKNRGRDPRSAVPSTPLSTRSMITRAPMAKPEPDYEVVEFPSDQYVNAKMQLPPPPPPRPPTGHPVDAGASCGLCGGGGARVRCTECGRRALCASCDDMYHRHPKRRNHQRQALSHSQLLDERPPLPPKAAPPVPPPRRHKIGGESSSASPRPPVMDQRRATLSMPVGHTPISTITNSNHFATQRPQIQHHQPVTNMSSHVGSMPYLPSAVHHTNTPVAAEQANTLGQFSSWGRPRGSLQGFNVSPNMMQQPPSFESWDGQEHIQTQSWGRPLRRGTSVMELGGGPPGCAGCVHCANPWRYGSCANLDHQWMAPSPAPGHWPQGYCVPHPASHNPRLVPQPHLHPSQTPQPYRRVESRAVSRAASRAGSRAPSPAMSVRSRTSRRSKLRSPSPAVPSSDADSESEVESDHPEKDEDSLGPAPPPPDASWQCEHCTFVNEPGLRVCAVCCRTPTTKPNIVTDAIKNGVAKLKVTEKSSRSPSIPMTVIEQPRIKYDDKSNKARTTKERVTTGCGPSPPREDKSMHKSINRLTTPPKREPSNEKVVQPLSRHDIAVGPSPPKEIQDKQDPLVSRTVTPTRSSNQVSQKNNNSTSGTLSVHSISVGPSPPRESPKRTTSSYQNDTTSFQKKSVGSSPPRNNINDRPLSRSSRTNTGTSPPPQSISTQTYEVPSNWERAQSVSRTSRSRRRLRDEVPRERSHSRVSLSSDTRESERSAQTSGGRWEWRERDSSPSGDWSESERRRASRLTRRASHLDVRRRPPRRTSAYGSEAPSPEPLSSNRAISLEALAAGGSRREAERGLELARLMSDAERMGFSAAEVHAALAQNPVAPLAWLSERWPSLCAGVRAAAARLAPGVSVSELEARAALARHRGAMWPAVNECVERSRRQTEVINVGEEGRLRGHVWGPPTGADDEGAPPTALSGRLHRSRADDSSDEFEVSTNKFQDDDWMYLPLDIDTKNSHEFESQMTKENKTIPKDETNSDIAHKLKALLVQAGIPIVDEKLLLKGLSGNHLIHLEENISTQNEKINQQPPNLTDFIQSENDFIDAYNALTRSSPLPSLNKSDFPTPMDDLEQKELKTMKNNKSVLTSDESPMNIIHKQKNNKSVLTSDESPMNIIHKQSTINKQSSLVSDNTSPEKSNLPNFKQNYVNNDNNDVIANHDEKPNNLSDMVDNTQKLIQQMKREINSDINSINDKSDSQSEAGNSTNESHVSSEKETSYSDTDSDSKDLTSDDKDTSTSEEENPNENFADPISISLNRTSSEDNENFEEAMDHVEHELEDFKQTNIEILNSIARSLQEEHTITIEVNEPQSRQNHQDLNNNLFAAVNTFEEIYAQLNNGTDKNESIKTEYATKKEMQNTHVVPELKPIAFTKENINTHYVKPESPIRVIITEQVPKVFNAIIENLESSEDETFEETSNVENGQVEEQLKELIIQEDNSNVNENMTLEINDTVIDKHEHDINNRNNDLFNERAERNNKINSVINSEIQNNNIRLQDKRDQNSPPSSIDGIILSNSQIDQTQAIATSTKAQDNLQAENHEKSYSQKSEKTKYSGSNKSNIPKLVKTIQSNKQKMENKNLPKVIASKVPIRRASLKQYPAPNPPRSHFGNVQSGHVKQLQTRLFNNKIVKANIETLPIAEVKPSTSTIKKNRAPPPPNQKITQVQSQTKETSVTKNKNDFFRETCRTEDEWTESDSEEQDYQTNSNKEEELLPVPLTPTQPITLRQISGQLIDLTQIRLPEGSPERQARMLLAEGATETWEQAKLAVDLIAQGTDIPAALLAALECADLTSALVYLHQDCELCASKFPEHEMVSMLSCTHRCCRECARHYFTVQITERSIVDCVCPYCKEPELENMTEDDWLDYFAHMDILLKTLLEIEVHELFQRKLRDRTLARDPNFKWCVECSSGFFVHPKQKKLRCPECKSITCSSCRKPWNINHDGVTCEQYAAWIEDNDPERSIAAVQQHLRENGLECPRCHFKYSLSRGGCMHFTCTQCKYEFCYGCGKPFTMGARCGLSDYCAKLGLHAHHPRNCLFYLRDKEPHELQTLLQMNNVTYETEAAEGSNNRCPIQLQRETPTGLVDTTCGSEVQQKQAGLCKAHYVEYLAGLARALDPIPIMEVSELVAELRRRALPLPERGPWDTDPVYAGMCAEIVREKIPLD